MPGAQFDQAHAAPAQAYVPAKAAEADLLGMANLSIAPQVPMAAAPAPAAAPVVNQVLLAPDAGKGLQINGGWTRRDGRLFLDMVFANQTPAPMTGFAIQFNRNTFGLVPGAPLNIPALNPGQSVYHPLPILSNGPVSQGPASTVVQMAVKNNIDILYFSPEVPLYMLFLESGKLEKQQYLQMWRAIPDSNEKSKDMANINTADLDAIQRKLEAHNVFFIARRKVAEQDVLYLSVRFVNDVVMLVELTFTPGVPAARACSKTQNLELVPLFEGCLEAVLRMP